MKGQSSKRYAVGILLLTIGGAGLADISIDNHIAFWIYAVMFSLGVGFCIWGFEQ